LYFEIQSLNDYGGESLQALREAVDKLVAAVASGDAAGFAAMMDRGRAYFDVRAASRAG
jgi:chorismate mutase/prephenate dehydrogenase